MIEEVTDLLARWAWHWSQHAIIRMTSGGWWLASKDGQILGFSLKPGTRLVCPFDFSTLERVVKFSLLLVG